jgi:hypothetical protein
MEGHGAGCCLEGVVVEVEACILGSKWSSDRKEVVVS